MLYSNLNCMLISKDLTQKEKACDLLLGYAMSSNPAIQLMAFESIIRNAVLFPSLWSVVEILCRKRSERIEVITFSWKRPGINYSSVWLYYYNLASRCLSTLSSAVMDAIAGLRSVRGYWSIDFSCFEEVLSSCKDVPDTMLAIELIDIYWNGKGIDAYVERKGLNDPILVKFAIALAARYEVAPSHLAQSELHIYFEAIPWSVDSFISGIWASMRALPVEWKKFDDDSQLGIWAEVLKMYRITQHRVRRSGGSTSRHYYRTFGKTWVEACHKELPGPEHANLRKRLLGLDDIRGEAICERFPPEILVASTSK